MKIHRKGSVISLIFSKEDIRKLVVPLLLEQALSITIGMADTIMVASCGAEAVSGISLVDSINILLINVFSALATGGAVVAAQYLGKKDAAQAAASAKQLMYTVWLFSSVIAAVSLSLRGPILRLLYGSIDPIIMENAMTYFLITAISFPFLGSYNGCAALLRAEGNSRASFITSTIMNVVNIIGNAVLIFVFHMGVTGAALSTLLSRMLGALLIFFTVRRKDNPIRMPDLTKLCWNQDLFKKICAVGVPTGTENGLFQFGKLILHSMISSFGTVAITANSIANTLTAVNCIPGAAVGLAMVTVVGQCMGAKEYDQAKYYIKRLMKLAYTAMIALNVVMLLTLPLLTGLFMQTQEINDVAMQMTGIHTIGCIFLWPMAFTFPNALRAANDARYTMTVSVLSMLVCRVAVGFLLSKGLGLGAVGVWIAMQVDWVCRIVFFVWRYRSGKWMRRQLV